MEHNTGSNQNKSDKRNNVSIVSRKKGYRDLDLSLKRHPITGKITTLKDDAAVKNALKNLILTNFFERPFQPSLGANLRGLLFEPADGVTRLAIKDNIESVVKAEPRIKLLAISITDLSDKNAYRVTMSYRIRESNKVEDVEIVLRRLR
jgi:phage baseplate assembly protein W